jgi:UPF0716 family protein affecting phage T7 exclusion
MAWPTPQDYNEAIQNPQINFADPELRAGRPELTPMGLPRPITGGFASVYRIQCGNRDYAVRCFLREYTDQQNRYLAISRHLAGLSIPYTVNFEYQPQGIRVGGKPYPILKMEWVQGDSLIEHVQRSLQNPAALLDLANQWALMIGELQRYGIAHGDLQHGNVLVLSDGKLKLIDYDGMFVPALAGQPSHEVGHRNYQMPNRTESDFGPYTDNFSAWVIYVSLLALSAEPALWTQFKAGDEYLLFKQDDFKQPDTSPLLAKLISHSDTRVQALAGIFQTLLYMTPGDVPTLNAPPEPPPSAGEWWKDAEVGPASQRPRPVPPKQPLTEAQPLNSVDWIVDNLGPGVLPTVPAYVQPTRWPRFALAMPLLFALALALLVPGTLTLVGGPLLFLIAFVLAILSGGGVLMWNFSQEPAVKALRPTRDRARIAKQRLARLNNDVRQIEEEKKQISVDEQKKLAKLQSERMDLEKKEQRERNAAQTKLQAALAAINNRRLQVNQQETQALNQAQSTISAKVGALDRQIGMLNQAMSNEMQTALDRIQAPFIRDYMQRQRISSASIYGIGDAYKSNLQHCGFHTAADVDYYRVQQVPGIGPTRAAAIEAWRRSVEREARNKMPGISPAEEAAIKAKYDNQRIALTAQRDAAQQTCASQEATIRADHGKLRTALDAEQRRIQSDGAQEAAAITARYQSEYNNLNQQRIQEQANAAAAIKAVDVKLGPILKELVPARWEDAKVQRELEAFASVTLRFYCLRALSLQPRRRP